jgi:hypothetical protein
MIKHFGLVGMLGFLTICNSIALLNWQNASLSITQYVFLSPESAMVFGVVNTVAAILIGLCLLGYIGPKWQLDDWFSFIAAVLMVCMFIVCWFPQPIAYVPDIHRIAGIITVCLMTAVTILLLITTWQTSSWAVRLSGVWFLGFTAVMLVISNLATRWYEDAVFFLEMLYFVMFFVFILALNYSKLKRRVDD